MSKQPAVDLNDPTRRGDDQPSCVESRFGQLLSSLQSVFEQEIRQLRNQNAQLHAQLAAAGASSEVESDSKISPRADGSPLRSSAEIEENPGQPRPQAWSENGVHTVPDKNDETRRNLRVSTQREFVLHQLWLDKRSRMDVTVNDKAVWADTRTMLKKMGYRYGTVDVEEDITDGFSEYNISKDSRFLVDPSGASRMYWDVAGMILISWDIITVPMMVFGAQEDVFSLMMSWATLMFWTGDMLWSCNTGIYKKGKLIMDRRPIIRNYLKTWFAIDCVVVVPDWVMTAMGSQSSVGKLGRVVKSARAIRVLRLLRLLKMRQLVNDFYDRINSEIVFLSVELIKLLSSLLIMNHLVACGWYGVGYLAKVTGAGKNWLEDVGMTPVYEGDLGWKYTTSLHWSITQFTPASMDVSATNTGERAFSVAVLFWALVALSSVISAVNRAMTLIRDMSGDQQKQFWLLRRYLKQRKVSKEVQQRIVKYLEFKFKAKQDVLSPSKVAYLPHISKHLTAELYYESYVPLLEANNFFRALSQEETSSVMFRVCSMALHTHEMAQEDFVFHHDEVATSMYFVEAGKFRYRTDPQKLSRKSFFSEASLWTTWEHRGPLCCASEMGEIISITSSTFGTELRCHPVPWGLALRYGQSFMEFMNSTDPSRLTDVTMNDFDTQRELRVSLCSVQDGPLFVE